MVSDELDIWQPSMAGWRYHSSRLTCATGLSFFTDIIMILRKLAIIKFYLINIFCYVDRGSWISGMAVVIVLVEVLTNLYGNDISPFL